MDHGLRIALDRTLLLMRDEFVAGVPDPILLKALAGTDVALVADEQNLKSHSSQSAFVTAAMLMARSGSRVHLVAPNVPIVGLQPPLSGRRLVSALNAVGRDLMPGIGFGVGAPIRPVDLAVTFGDSRLCVRAQKVLAVHADAWSASLSTVEKLPRWNRDVHWPLGGLAAAALVAGEAFKISMRKLSQWASNPSLFERFFEEIKSIDFPLAPTFSAQPSELGNFDFISGGAITNSVLYCLGRIPQVSGFARVIEKETSDLTNLNRYLLLLRSRVGELKGIDLAAINFGGLRVEPLVDRYESSTLKRIGPLSSRVLVGVDHIPTRWEVQNAMPSWLGVGATTHWSSMASFHTNDLPCAGCLHHLDDPTNATIPTLSIVSFWAGLLLAIYFLREVSGETPSYLQQQTYLTFFQPDLTWRSPIAYRADCPTALHNSQKLA